MTTQLNFNAAANNQYRVASFSQTSILKSNSPAPGRNSHFDDEEFQLDV